MIKSLMIAGCCAWVTVPLAALAEARLVEVAAFDTRQPVGVTISEQGRLFVTFPRQSGTKTFQHALVEIVNGEERPYPDIAWNAPDPSPSGRAFINVQAAIAEGNHLWVLDSSQPFGGNTQGTMKLVRIDLNSNQVERIYRFEDIPAGSAALNDVRIDRQRQLAYFSDPKRSALVVLDLRSGASRTLLAGTRPTSAEPDFVLHIDGQDVRDRQGRAFVSNANGIALSNDGQWFYFRAINQQHLYRVQTRYLAAPDLSDAQLLEKVEDLGKVGVSHGMIADHAGRVYLSDSINHAINRWSADSGVSQLLSDPRLSWPDTFAIAPDHTLYVTAAQINRTGVFSGIDRVEYPYRLYKVVEN